MHFLHTPCTGIGGIPKEQTAEGLGFQAPLFYKSELKVAFYPGLPMFFKTHENDLEGLVDLMMYKAK